MKTYQQAPDYIPFKPTEFEFYHTIQNLSESTSKTFFANRDGLKAAGKIAIVMEKVKGWMGLKDHTAIPNVESALVKFLYYGYCQGYHKNPKNQFGKWIASLKEKTDQMPFSVQLADVLSLLKDPKGDVKAQLEAHLQGIHAQYTGKVNRIGGGKAKIPQSETFAFGMTPLRLAQHAFKKGKWSQALDYAEEMHRNDPTNQELRDLYIQIGKHFKRYDATLIKRLLEIKSQALNEKDDATAYGCMQIIRRLVPEKTTEESPSIFLRFFRIACNQRDFSSAFFYLDQAERLGVPTQEDKKTLFVSLYEKAETDQQYAKATTFYEKALELGHAKDHQKFGDLCLHAAKRAKGAEAVTFYEKAIKAYQEGKKLIIEANKGTWLHSYLKLLKKEGSLKQGIFAVETLAETVVQKSRIPQNILNNPKALSAHITRHQSYISFAMKLFTLLEEFDPKNGEHPFWLGILRDQLNVINDFKDTYPHFKKALKLDPTNKYYRYCSVEAKRKKVNKPEEVPEHLQEGYALSWDIKGWYDTRFSQGFQAKDARTTLPDEAREPEFLLDEEETV